MANDHSREDRQPPTTTERSKEDVATGISNRPDDEEAENQEAVPPRGERKPGAHAG